MEVRWKNAVLLAAAMVLPGEQVAAQPQAKPDLVVMLAIDQMGSLLFDRYRGSYREGLMRLIDEGIIYSNAYQCLIRLVARDFVASNRTKLNCAGRYQ